MVTVMGGKKAIRGTLVHATSYGSIQVLDDHIIVLDQGKICKPTRSVLCWSQITQALRSLMRPFTGGKILTIEEGECQDRVLHDHGLPAEALVRLSTGQLLVPGFVDTHVHAPQYSYTGTATDKPLMQWLEHYTFPREAAMQDLAVAESVYGMMIRRLLANGTSEATFPKGVVRREHPCSKQTAVL
jgi:Amidohydrolase family